MSARKELDELRQKAWEGTVNMSEEIGRLRAENERLVKERDEANDALTIAYMQGAASAEARAQSAEAERDELRIVNAEFANVFKERDAAEAALAEMRAKIKLLLSMGEYELKDAIGMVHKVVSADAIRALLSQGGHDGKRKGD